MPKGQQSLVTWATPRLSEDKVHQCVDPKLNKQYPPKAVESWRQWQLSASNTKQTSDQI
ncbi:putative protein kinase [Acorus calamus]|uniref:Uncharacterized protein n=1 Tax=Acorus calamus TaxID=4465 RepID=A0AAV9E4E8_ACOCL|nr:putative protein kinase [Acorus calamus]